MISKIEIKKETRQILRINQFSLQQNKINFLFGESGIGKSLISKSIFDVFIEPILDVNFKTNIEDKELNDLRRNGFYIFQEASSSLNQEMTIKEQLDEGEIKNIELPDEIYKAIFPNFSNENYNNLIKRYPDAYQPSGGEKQRLLLVMLFKKYFAYINRNEKSALFVLDEAVANLDEKLRNKVIDIILFLYNEKKSTLIFISHDYSIIEYIADKHQKELKNSAFTELERINDIELVQKDFEVMGYLSWIKNIRKVPVKQTEVLLSINKSIQIYNMNLELRNANNSDEILFHKGNIYQIKAASGVGKTTFARVLNGSIKAEQFSMKIKGKSYTEKSSVAEWEKNLWGKEISMVFQQADEALNSEATVSQIFKRLNIKSLKKKSDIFSFLKSYFDNIDLQFVNKKIKNLSGGQKQRINLLRSIAVNTRFIILDEPLTGLDFRTVQLVLTLLKNLLKQDKSILLISHNESLFDRFIPEENIIYLENVC
jgi:ABC-type glutathione transport system ATPase component